MANPKIIVGLGNPGSEYELTRHNVGFMLIDALLKKFKFQEIKFNDGLLYIGQIKRRNVYLAKPLTYMNLSGTFVKRLMKMQKADLSDLVVVYDELDLPIGKLKLKAKGSCAGHNGIRNIIEGLDTENIQRIRIGIRNERYESAKKIKYVLEKFSADELNELTYVFERVITLIEKILEFGFEYSLNCYNNSGGNK